jgi:hypothetical protein
MRPKHVSYLSAKFGLPESVFTELVGLGLVGGNSHGLIFVFPERSADGTITGLKEREPGPTGDQQKYQTRSRPGLTIPARFANSTGPVLITEGASCTLAATAAGLSAVGRPSVSGGTEELAKLLADIDPARPVVVIVENDAKNGKWPGMTGSRGIATQLAKELRRTVLLGMVPDGAKDLRDWFNARRAPTDTAEAWAESGQDFLESLLTHAEEIAPASEDEAPRNSAPGNSDAGLVLTGSSSATPEGTEAQPAARPKWFKNYWSIDVSANDTMKEVEIPLPVSQVRQELFRATNGWPKVCDSILFVPSGPHSIRWLRDENDLFAWIDATLCPKGGERRTIDWSTRCGTVTTRVFYADLRANAEKFATVDLSPQFPPKTDTYYAHEPPAGGDLKALDRLVSYFCPESAEDGLLIRAVILTLFWSGRPPAFLFASQDDDGNAGRGVGKTTMARILASLVGGAVSLRPDEDFNRFVSRLLSPTAMSKRVVLLDNVKATKMSSAAIEAFLTDDVISGHRLFHGEASRVNNLTTFITANAATLSKDLADRVVEIRVRRPEYGPSWESDVKAFVASNRAAIWGDAIRLLEVEPTERIDRSLLDRWSPWQNDVLAHAGPGGNAAVKLIADRRRVIDADRSEADALRDEILTAVVRQLRIGLTGSALESSFAAAEDCVVLIPSKVMARLVTEATGEPQNRKTVVAYVSRIGVEGLARLRRSDFRGWIWRGRMRKGKPDPNSISTLS